MPKRLLLTAVLASLTLAACGGSSETPEHKTTTTSTTGQSALGSVHPPGWGAEGPPPSHRLTLAPGLHTMYDDVTVSVIPRGALAAAGYTAGAFDNFAELTLDFPRAHKIAVAIRGNVPGDCLDVEPGDAEPWEAPLWIKDGHHCLYSDWSEFTTEVIPALRGAGINPASVEKWDADLHSPALDSGFQATQYSFNCLGRNLDCSVVTPRFLGIAHPPFRPAPPCNARCQRIKRDLRARRHELRAIEAHMRRSHCLVKHPRRACGGLYRHRTEVRALVRKLERQLRH